MVVTIFGASGRTGKHIVRKALEKGYAVRAFVRNRARLPIESPRLTVIEGDVSDFVAVERAIAGADAVVSALGWTRTSKKSVLSEAARAMVAAMHQHGVRRIIALTGYGVRFPGDPPDSFSKKLIHFILDLALPHLVPDGIAYARTIAESGLDWTVVRVPLLSNAPATGSYRSGSFNPALRPVSREDVADFMIGELASPRYLRAAPMLGV